MFTVISTDNACILIEVKMTDTHTQYQSLGLDTYLISYCLSWYSTETISWTRVSCDKREDNDKYGFIGSQEFVTENNICGSSTT